MDLKIKYVKTSELQTYSNNAKKHTEEDVSAIRHSIEQFGFNDPIGIWHGVIVEGHGRLMAAQELGMETVPVIELDHLTDEQRRAYALAHNKTAELSGWDFNILDAELANISDFDMAEFGFELAEEETAAADVSEDEYDFEKKVEPRTKRGDIYQLGDHRLMCGDATANEELKTLMGEAEADVILTDPPYNVALGMSGSKDDARIRHRRTDGLVIMNDKMRDDEFYHFLLQFYTCAFKYLKPGAAFYIWHADNNGLIFRKALRDAGEVQRQTLIWNKNTITLGRQDYQWKHEPCLYGWKEGAPHNWYSDRKQTTVLEFPKPSRSEMHPSMKPIALFAYQIECSTKKETLCLIALEDLGQRLLHVSN